MKNTGIIIQARSGSKRLSNKIFKLMSKNGYTRVYKFFSYMDDWYIKYNGNEII